MTIQQIRWASQHDWFISRNADNSISVRGDVACGDKEIETFDDFELLRQWAGY